LGYSKPFLIASGYSALALGLLLLDFSLKVGLVLCFLAFSF
jgi:hypothetical protein